MTFQKMTQLGKNYFQKCSISFNTKELNLRWHYGKYGVV